MNNNNEITEFVDKFGNKLSSNPNNKSVFEIDCKIGDTIYGIASYCIDCVEHDDCCHRGCTNPKYRLIKSTIHHFIISEKGIEICDFSEDICGTLNEDVFLNIDDAKVALKKANANK